MYFSKKSNKKIAIFLSCALISASMLTGCSLSDPPEESQDSYSFQELLDDNGQEYILTQNEDGTETARYPDGEEVTMRRHDDGTIDYVSGTAGLITGLAAGYLLFHGLAGGSGVFNAGSGRFIPSTPYARLDEKDKKEWQRSTYVPRASVHHDAEDSHINSKSSNASPHAVVKGGFGGAGARSAAS